MNSHFKRYLKNNYLLIFISLSTLLFLTLFFVFFKKNTSITNKYDFIYINEKDNFNDIVSKLEPYLISTNTFIIAANLKKYSKNFKSGKFKLNDKLNNDNLIDILRGESMTVNITFNNQEKIEDLAKRVSDQIEADSLSLINAFKDSIFLEKTNFNNLNLISMYLPNTYNLYWNTSAEDFRERMYLEYKKYWNKNRILAANKIGLDPIEVITLASIINKESPIFKERKKIAGVYLNRLKKRIKLQADPTVIFAIKNENKKYDTIIKRVLLSDLKINSKFNTYKIKGLPPGPICMPDLTSIEAVLNADKHDYIFFVADPDKPGYHNFSKSLKMHNFYKRKYINWINRLKILR